MKSSVVTFVLFTLCAIWIVKEARCAKIMAVIPTPSYSHQIPYRRLWLELHKRGHEVVLVTTNPIPNVNLTNFTQIDISAVYNVTKETVKYTKNRINGISWLQFMGDYLFYAHESFAEVVLNNTEMRRLYAPDSNEKFDVIFIETLYVPAMYGLVYRFDAPLIGLSSLGLTTYHEYALGGVVLPSHEYTWEMEEKAGPNLPFWKRVHNFVYLWWTMYDICNYYLPRQHKVAENYLGMKLPPLIDIIRNMSLLFVNQAEPLTPARPKLANMITFTSSHVDENPAPLSKDLQRFLDEADEGFIYFSLGSNAKSSDMPMEIQQIFIDVFEKLPYRIVWKYETEFPRKMDNVFTGKWFPQQSILAHPNIKLFIYQGGLQSSEEAVHFAVPLVVFPVLGDQDYQASRMDTLGLGKRLEIRTITRGQLDSAIREVITNKSYKERMIQIRDQIRDTPYDMVEHLAWWTEYVIRHKGAPHLRSSLAWLPWHQRYDIDVIMFLTVVAFVIVSKSVNIIARITIHLHKRYLRSTSQKQKIS